MALLARGDVLNLRKNITGTRATSETMLIPAKKTFDPPDEATTVCVVTVTVNGTELADVSCRGVEGFTEQAAACGAPVHVSVTAPVKPPLGDKFKL